MAMNATFSLCTVPTQIRLAVHASLAKLLSSTVRAFLVTFHFPLTSYLSTLVTFLLVDVYLIFPPFPFSGCLFPNRQGVNLSSSASSSSSQLVDAYIRTLPSPLQRLINTSDSTSGLTSSASRSAKQRHIRVPRPTPLSTVVVDPVAAKNNMVSFTKYIDLSESSNF